MAKTQRHFIAEMQQLGLNGVCVCMRGIDSLWSGNLNFADCLHSSRMVKHLAQQEGNKASLDSSYFQIVSNSEKCV